MSEKRRVLIADDIHECIIPLLENEGYETVYSPSIDRSALLKVISDFEGLIIRSKTSVDQALIDAAHKLEFVARAGAGMDKVDIDYLNSKGIKALNAPEGNRDALGEHAVGMLLSLLHRIDHGNDQVSHGKWERESNRGIELGDKIVGVYGVGNMGMSFAKKLQGFDCKVLGYDAFKKDYSNAFIQETDLEIFMDQVEILSIHVPLNEGTEYLFDHDYLSRFKSLKILMNTARGEILASNALVQSLKERKLFGAALDVLENERLEKLVATEQEDFTYLQQHPNVIITPHVGGWTYESYRRISEVIVRKIADLD